MELSSNKIFRTVSANPSNYTEGNYELYGELRVERVPGSGTFTPTLKAYLTPDLSDEATFELQDGAADFFPLPDFNPAAVTAITMINDNQVLAQFWAAESFGDPPVLQTLTLRDTFRILNGGMPKIFDSDFFNIYLPSNPQFLTWHPGAKHVTFNQPEILHFYAFDGVTNVTQKLKVYFSDGTNQTVDVQAGVSVTEGRIYRVPAGYQALNVNQVDSEKKAIKYETWIETNTGDPVAAPFLFIIEEVAGPNNRNWMFVNSLGMWEVIRTSGKTIDNFNVSRQDSITYLPEGYSRFDGEIKSRVIASENQLQVSTGFFDSKEESLWATELLITPKLVLLEAERRTPYIVTSNESVRFDEQNYQWFMRFNARLAFNDTKYAPV